MVVVEVLSVEPKVHVLAAPPVPIFKVVAAASAETFTAPVPDCNVNSTQSIVAAP